MTPLLDGRALADAVGLAVVHSVWQGGLFGVAFAASLTALRRHSPGARYLLGVFTMAGMFAASAATFALALRGSVGPLGINVGDLPLAGLGASLGHAASPALPTIGVLWATGAGVLQFRMILHWISAQRLRRGGVHPAPEVWRREFAALSRRFGVTRAARLVESARVSVPSVIGWLRPVVLLPAGVIDHLTPAQLRAVLAHELAHVRRHDYLVNLAQCVFETLLFFHPVTWWVSGRIRAEREYCCDDLALTVTDRPLDYARALSTLEELRGSGGQPALAATGGHLMRRISRILEHSQKGSRNFWVPALLSVVGLMTLGVLFGVGCLDATAPDVAVASDGPSASSPADIQAMVAEARVGIEAARTDGRISDEVADRCLAHLDSGDFKVADDGCCGADGEGTAFLIGAFDCGPEGEGAACETISDCADIPAGCTPQVVVLNSEDSGV